MSMLDEVDSSLSQTSTPVSQPTYENEVLALRDGQTEEHWDEQLRTEAKELGVNLDDVIPVERPSLQFAVDPMSPPTRTCSTDTDAWPRRSESINSRMSQSTGMTSNYSELSKEQRAPGSRLTSRFRSSLSFRDYDAFVPRGLSNGRHSISFFPLATPSHSSLSLSISSRESSPRRNFRRLKGLSMLKLHRSDSGTSKTDGCPHCPPDPLSQRRAVYKLPCGHRLCIQALRSSVKNCTDAKTGAAPSCCGEPIPTSLVELVVTQEEQSIHLDKLNKLEYWDEAASIATSGTSDNQESVSIANPGSLSVESGTPLPEPEVDPAEAAKERIELEQVMERSDFCELRRGQVELRDRFFAWVGKLRGELDAHQQQLCDAMKARHESATEALREQHCDAMVQAEDIQVNAEAEMRVAHEQEMRDNATVLKHREAYCAGQYSTGEAHHRTVTEQDRSELEKSRRLRHVLVVKHASAINVLRGEQGRRIKSRAQRQEREMQELQRGQKTEERELKRECTGEMYRLEEDAAAKRTRIVNRWEIETAIFVKKVEAETGIVVAAARLTKVEWRSDGYKAVAGPGWRWRDGYEGFDGGPANTVVSTGLTAGAKPLWREDVALR